MSKTIDSIVDFFKDNGLNLLGGALTSVASGNPLPLVASIASTIGSDATPEAVEKQLKVNNPELLIKLKQLEQTHEVELQKIILEHQRLENEKYLKAHDTYKETHEMADKIAQQVIRYNLPVVALLVVLNIIVLHFFREDATLIAIASNVIGVAIGHLFNERQSIVNFFFGSSIGSKKKSEQLAEHSKKQ